MCYSPLKNIAWHKRIYVFHLYDVHKHGELSLWWKFEQWLLVGTTVPELCLNFWVLKAYQHPNIERNENIPLRYCSIGRLLVGTLNKFFHFPITVGNQELTVHAKVIHCSIVFLKDWKQLKCPIKILLNLVMA